MKRRPESFLRALPLLAFIMLPTSSPKAVPLASRISESIIAVGIAHRAANIVLRPIGEFSVIDQSNGEMRKLERGARYIVEADENQRLILGKHLFSGPTRLLPGKPEEHVLIGDRKYRGNILFQPNKDATVTAIGEMGIEEYLQGVLPNEMNPAWPLEALKAQAVVARTFALNNLGKFSESGYDLSDDAFSQVYSGLELESDRVKQAVRATAGEVLSWEGKNLDAYFHSTCGGHTTDPSTAWGSKRSGKSHPKPLRGVRDGYCSISPSYRWEAYFGGDDILKVLHEHGIRAARLSRIRIGRRGANGYVSTVEMELDGKWKSVDAHPLRLWLGPTQLKSTQIRKVVKRRNGFLFKGRGYGHGVGLCQWGTRVQAINGRSYREILDHYFPHADIVRKNF